MHVDLWDCLYIDYGEFSYCGDSGINWVLKVLIEHLGWLNVVEVIFETVMWKGSSQLSEYLCFMAAYVLNYNYMCWIGTKM